MVQKWENVDIDFSLCRSHSLSAEADRKAMSLDRAGTMLYSSSSKSKIIIIQTWAMKSQTTRKLRTPCSILCADHRYACDIDWEHLLISFAIVVGLCACRQRDDPDGEGWERAHFYV